MEHEFRPLAGPPGTGPGTPSYLVVRARSGPGGPLTQPGRGASRGRGRDSELSLLACFSWMHADVALFWIRFFFSACYRAGFTRRGPPGPPPPGQGWHGLAPVVPSGSRLPLLRPVTLCDGTGAVNYTQDAGRAPLGQQPAQPGGRVGDVLPEVFGGGSPVVQVFGFGAVLSGRRGAMSRTWSPSPGSMLRVLPESHLMWSCHWAGSQRMTVPWSPGRSRVSGSSVRTRATRSPGW